LLDLRLCDTIHAALKNVRASTNGRRSGAHAARTRSCGTLRRISQRRSSTTDRHVAFVDDHRPTFGGEPIYAVLPIAPATYYAHKARGREPDKRSARARRDEVLLSDIGRVHAENFEVFCDEKVWRQLGHEGVTVARCTVERLMRGMDPARRCSRPSLSSHARRSRGGDAPARSRRARLPRDSPQRAVGRRPQYVATCVGFVYVAFGIAVFSDAIVGWRVSRRWSRRGTPGPSPAISCTSDRGMQYLSIRYTERLSEAGIERSVGSVGDSCRNALAEDRGRTPLAPWAGSPGLHCGATAQRYAGESP
jgi:putative transposase